MKFGDLVGSSLEMRWRLLSSKLWTNFPRNCLMSHSVLVPLGRCDLPFRKRAGSLISSKCIFSSTVSSNLGWSRDLQIINLIWMETARPSVGRRMLRWKRRRETGKRRKQNFLIISHQHYFWERFWSFSWILLWVEQILEQSGVDRNMKRRQKHFMWVRAFHVKPV